jgi:hypothetical protein
VAQLVEALRRKPVGSISNGVIKIFHCLTPSGRTVTDKASTEISIMDISWGVMAAGA